MNIYLVRHGETKANKEKIYCGNNDYDLTDKGIEQSISLIDYFQKRELDYIYSSPLKRAKIIGVGVEQKKDIDLIIDKRLKEYSFGIFEGMTYEEINKTYPYESKEWMNDFVNYKIPEGESLGEMYDRVKTFVNDIQLRDNNTCMIVAHSGIIQASILCFLGLSLKKFWNFKVPLGGIVEIEYKDGFGILKGIKELN